MDNNQQTKIMIGRDNIFRLFFATSGRINGRMYITAYALLAISFGVFYISSSYLYPAISTLILILIVFTAAISDFILTSKRLKDIGLSPRLSILKVILNFVGIGLAITLLLSIIPGRRSDNRHGTPPFKINVPIKVFRRSAFRFNTRVHRFMFVQYNILLLLIVLLLATPLGVLVYLGIIPLGGGSTADTMASASGVVGGGFVGDAAAASGDINVDINLSTMIVPIAYVSVLALIYLYGFLGLLKNRVNDIGLRRGATPKLLALLVSLIALDVVHRVGFSNLALTLVASVVSTVFLVSFTYLIFAPSERCVNSYGRRSRELVPPDASLDKSKDKSKGKFTDELTTHHSSHAKA